MIKYGGIVVKPTVFPDGTTQVWKVLGIDREPIVQWEFPEPIKVPPEEFTQVLQLCQLASKEHGYCILQAPFLPYSRQDKEVSNESTFGLHTMLKCLHAVGVTHIETFDMHHEMVALKYPMNVENTPADDTITGVAKHCGADYVCFPDKGAQDRYAGVRQPSFFLEKKRDQSTGRITGITIPNGTPNISGKRVLIADDICDGGATFVEASMVLRHNYDCPEMFLCVSHGIFSKGTNVLRRYGSINSLTTADGGYFRAIYTRNGLYEQ